MATLPIEHPKATAVLAAISKWSTVVANGDPIEILLADHDAVAALLEFREADVSAALEAQRRQVERQIRITKRKLLWYKWFGVGQGDRR